MKALVGALSLLVLLAGCSAPVAGPPSTTAPSPTGTEAPSPTPTLTPTPDPTPTGPTHGGLGATITSINTSDRVALATVRFRNFGESNATGSLAFRFVENDSHALIDTTRLAPGQTETFQVPLRLHGDDPANLTVQVRINGTIVAERAVTDG